MFRKQREREKTEINENNSGRVGDIATISANTQHTTPENLPMQSCVHECPRPPSFIYTHIRHTCVAASPLPNPTSFMFAYASVVWQNQTTGNEWQVAHTNRKKKLKQQKSDCMAFGARGRICIKALHLTKLRQCTRLSSICSAIIILHMAIVDARNTRECMAFAIASRRVFFDHLLCVFCLCRLTVFNPWTELSYFNFCVVPLTRCYGSVNSIVIAADMYSYSYVYYVASPHCRCCFANSTRADYWHPQFESFCRWSRKRWYFLPVANCWLP